MSEVNNRLSLDDVKKLIVTPKPYDEQNATKKDVQDILNLLKMMEEQMELLHQRAVILSKRIDLGEKQTSLLHDATKKMAECLINLCIQIGKVVTYIVTARAKDEKQDTTKV